MTGLVRKATLFGVCAMLAASAALANVPDLGQSMWSFGTNDPLHVFRPATPRGDHVFVTGTLQSGANADPLFRGRIQLKDFSGNQLSGRVVRINFRAACDINLCTFVKPADQADYSTQVLTDSSVVRGITDDTGEFQFNIVGAAKAPTHVNTAGGGRFRYVHIFVDDVYFTSVTGVALDQDGALVAVPGGPTGADIGKLATNVGQVGLGGQYVGRGDINADGAMNGADIGVEASHVGRYGLNGGAGCPAPFILDKTAKCPSPW